MRLLLALLALSACTAHRAAMPSGYDMVPSFPEPGELIGAASVTALGDNSPSYSFRIGGRLSEHVALGFIAAGPMHEGFDDLLPNIQLGFEGTLLVDVLRVDLSLGTTQSAFFAGGRIGVAHQLRWAQERFGVRGAAAVFGAAPLNEGCGEFVSCPNGPTRSSYGAEASLVFGARIAGVEVAVGPRTAAIRVGDDTEVIFGLVIQLDLLVRFSDQTLPMRAPSETSGNR